MKSRNANFIFLLIFFSQQVLGTLPRIQLSKLIDHLNISPKSSEPLIVIVNSGTERHNVHNALHISADDSSEDDGLVGPDDAKEEAKNLLYNYLLRSGNPNQNNSNEIIEEEQKTALRTVLRSRCQAVNECTYKCKKKKKVKSCNYCKEIYDRLKLCDSSKSKKKKKCECGRFDGCDGNSDDCDEKLSKYESSENCGKWASSNECGEKKGKRGRTMPAHW